MDPTKRHSDSMDSHWRWLAKLCLLVGILFIAVAPGASANDKCGGVNQRECNFWEQTPSCDSGLTARDGKCHNCGGSGEYACAATVQLRGCDSGMIEVGGRCEGCGDTGERACPITVQTQGCNGNRIEVRGRCQPCGGENQRACPFTVQLQGCSGRRIEVAGRCESCGASGQRACPVTETVSANFSLRGCDDGHIEVAGRCEPCGDEGERACPATVQWQGCNGRQVEAGGRCEPCGAAGERACPVTETLTAEFSLRGCDDGHIEVAGRCETCGALGERACPITVGKACADGRHEADLRTGRCVWSSRFAENPFEFFNGSPSEVFVTAHFKDLERQVEYAGPYNTLRAETVPAGETVAINIAGTICQTSVSVTTPGIQLSQRDYCEFERFNLYVWRNKAAYDEAFLKQAAVDAVKNTVADIVDGQSGASGDSGAPGMLAQELLNITMDALFGTTDGRLGVAQYLNHVVVDIPQEDRWIAFWGEWKPTENGLLDGDIEPSELIDPCSRPQPAKIHRIVGGEDGFVEWTCDETDYSLP
ncbi:MAG: hypothetical protein AAF829_02845 [Pseudomonadota bacterium]